MSLVLVAWLYSVPPVRLKERPPLDSLANGLGYFLLPFAMGYSLGADPRTMPLRYYLLALCVCGVHALATAADYEADRAAGHRTFAVAFGRRVAAAFAFAAFFVTWLFVEFQAPGRASFIVSSHSSRRSPRRYFRADRVIFGACITIFAGFCDCCGDARYCRLGVAFSHFVRI